jgi:glycosyltransferase involved in cell wall biosynthesis
LKISIIIPAFNEEWLLGETLKHVQAAASVFVERDWSSEIIVCNNNSTDRTAEIALAAGAQVVFEPINQIARARNTGAAAATGDWLIFVDADSRPSPELFREVAAQFALGRCVAGGTTVKMEDGHLAGHFITGLWNCISRALLWMAGSFIFCETAAFRQLGGFSHELFAAEELELSKRLKAMARASDRKIVILHRHPLVTSGRKMHLYTGREHLRFLVRTVLAGGKTLNRREDCPTWYDGRR